MQAGLGVTVGTRVLYEQLMSMAAAGFATPLSLYRQMHVAMALIPAQVARELTRSMDSHQIPGLLDPEIAGLQRALLGAVAERGW